MEKRKHAVGIYLLALILILAGICIWLLHGSEKQEALGGTLVQAPVYMVSEEETPSDEEAVYFWFGEDQV